jgi:uncharacterized phage protein (TIGR02220 family)
MAKDPAVLFYTSDFLTGTSFFTDEQRGQYIRLLCEQHQNGHIPENHMVCVCFSLASPVVKKFIKDSDGNYFNERMEKEILKRIEFTESRRLNGLKGGRPKEENKPSGLPSGKPTNNLIGNGNDIDNIIEYLNIKSRKNFKSNSKATIKHINARLSEGFSIEDFKKVVDNKCNQWLNDPKFCEYLRPETLFGTKFESYLNSKKINNPDSLIGKGMVL